MGIHMAMDVTVVEDKIISFSMLRKAIQMQAKTHSAKIHPIQ